LKFNENNSDRQGNTWEFIAWNSSDYDYLWWTGGYIKDDWCFRCGDITNPNNLSWFLVDTWIYRSCNSRWNDAIWKPDVWENIWYQYWINTPKQIQPLQYSGTEIIFSDFPYSWDLYIGEINNIWENSDIECNNCEWQYSVTWDNSNFVNSWFWSQNPNSCDVISAFYGTWKFPNTTTAYTKNRTWSQTTNFCHIENMRVVDVSPWVDVFSWEISSYTIYVLSWWDYILSGVSQLNLNHCSTIVAKNTWYFYSTWVILQMFYINNKNNVVFQNLEINWSENWFGWSHNKNTRGIYMYSSPGINNLLYNISILNNNSYWIYLRWRQFYIEWLSVSNSNNWIYSQYLWDSILTNIEAYNNSNWLYISSSSNNIFKNADIYWNNNMWIYLINSPYSIFDNINIYNNRYEWIYVYNWSNYTILKNSLAYNNGRYWINVSSSTNINIENVQTYNNIYEWIVLNPASYSNLNNVQSYNNTRYWIGMKSNSNYFSLNNILSYNNGDVWIYINASNTWILNNIYSYNNFWAGIELMNSSNILSNNISALNNQRWLYLRWTSTWYLYYWNFWLYDNSIDLDLATWSINQWTTNDFWWNPGYFDTISCFRCWDIVNPTNNLSWFFVNTWLYRACNYRWNDDSWIPQTWENIQYQYWVNIPKQIQPLQYSGMEIINSDLYYSWNLYIGEINNIWENNDTTCNNCEWNYFVTWDNDNFIDSWFWDQSPNSCDIMSALYGTWLDREDTTSYTKNWTWSMNIAFCDIENMQVINIEPWIDTLPQDLQNYTVYILSWWNYILSWNSTVNLGNCNAIITKNNTWYFYSTGKIDQLLYAKNKSNVILQWLEINGTWNWFDWSHTKNDYWINFDGDNKNNVNTLFYNVGVYNNQNQWIYLRRLMSNNSLTSIFVYNNSNWIEINQSNNNNLYNIKSFNNSNWIELYNSSNNNLNNLILYWNNYWLKKYYSSNNLVYDSKIFDNDYDWIYLRSSNWNHLKNLIIYDNKNNWVYFNWASSNVLEKSEIYNNNNWIKYYNYSNYNTIKNLTIFNNYTNWLEFSYAVQSNNSFSNSQIFNNKIGMLLTSGLSGNIFDNISIYNNSSYWISLWSDKRLKNNIFHNLSVYNNTKWFYNIYNITGNFIYWSLNLFWNSWDIDWSFDDFIFWDSNDYSYLWWTWWHINSWLFLDLSYITNVDNGFGHNLLNWTWDYISMRWDKIFDIESPKISYWANIPRQVQSVIWSWDQLILSWVYDTNKYIGGDDVALTWILSWWNNTWNSSLLDLLYLATPWFQYNLFGDVYVGSSWEVNTPISLILSQWTWTKTIVSQLFDGNSFTHFVYTSDYVDLPYVDILDVQNQKIIENDLLNWWYQESTWSVQWMIQWYFIGKKDIRLYHSNWELLVPVVMQSTWEQLLEVQLSSWTVVKTKDNQPYTGIISIPTQKNPLESWLSWAIAAISVWSNNISLQLRDSENNPISAIIRIPVLAEIGENMDVYYSEDNWDTWEFHVLTNTVLLSGLSYVEFTTTHFTDFAIVGVGELPPEPLTWSFVINNDEAYTLTSVVLLSLDASWATHMKFSNDNENRSDWIEYIWSYERILSEWYWEKIVYADIDFDADGTWDILTSDSILYSELPLWQQWWNLTLTITWWVTQCVYGTSLNLWSQDGNLWTEGYIFSGDFSPANRYCADYKWLSGWVFTIQTTDLINENWGVISGSNVFISHDVPVVQGHDSCTGHNWDETQFYGSPLSLIEKAEVANNDKICKVDISNVKLKVDVPAYQAPGDYIGTLTITLPNGFEN